jgi:hypothetical protein
VPFSYVCENWHLRNTETSERRDRAATAERKKSLENINGRERVRPKKKRKERKKERKRERAERKSRERTSVTWNAFMEISNHKNL